MVEEVDHDPEEPAAKPSRETMRRFLQNLPAMLQERYERRLSVVVKVARARIEVTTERVRLEKVVL